MLPTAAGIVPNQTTLTHIEGGSTNVNFAVPRTRAATKTTYTASGIYVSVPHLSAAHYTVVSRDRAVGIATDYGLDE
jgi:hypothetical protein